MVKVSLLSSHSYMLIRAGLWQGRVCMNTLPYTASCASNRLLTLLCKLNVNVECVFSGSAVVVLWLWSYCKPRRSLCCQRSTLPDILVCCCWWCFLVCLFCFLFFFLTQDLLASTFLLLFLSLKFNSSKLAPLISLHKLTGYIRLNMSIF